MGLFPRTLYGETEYAYYGGACTLNEDGSVGIPRQSGHSDLYRALHLVPVAVTCSGVRVSHSQM